MTAQMEHGRRLNREAEKGRKTVTHRNKRRLRDSVRRKLFIALYSHPDYARNGTKAAIDAGYSPTRARVTASELLADVDVRREIDAEMGRQVERTRITTDRILKELARIAFANLRDIVDLRTVKRGRSIRQELVLKGDSLDRLHPDDSSAICEIQVTKKGPRVRLHDKMAALLALLKHQQLFCGRVPTPSHPVLSTDEARRRVVLMFLDAMRRETSASDPIHAELLREAYDAKRPAFIALVKEFLATNEKMTEFLRAAFDRERPAFIALVKDFAATIRKDVAPAGSARSPSSRLDPSCG